MNREKAKVILNSPDSLECLFTDPQLSGFSGKKITALLQNLATCLDPEKEVYLEIGVFRGLSLISVSKVFDGKTFGIDNFSQFDPEKKNYNLIHDHFKRLGINNANLINLDFEVALKNLKDHLGDLKIGLLFIDGPHDYRSQLMCLIFSRLYLSKDAVIIVDDSNYRHVRQANDDFITSFPEFRLEFERYTKAHPRNMSPEQRELAGEGWWNGINVLANSDLTGHPVRKVSTIENRTLYYNDHLVHSSRYADCAPEAMAVTHTLKPFRPLKLINRLVKLYKRINGSDPLFKGRYRHLNTYTDEMA